MSLLLGVLKRRIAAMIESVTVKTIDIDARQIIKAISNSSSIHTSDIELRALYKAFVESFGVPPSSDTQIKLTILSDVDSFAVSQSDSVFVVKGEVINPNFPFFSPRYKYFKRSNKMESFAELRFEDGVVTLDMAGGTTFSTTVVTTNGGKEQRQSNWEQPRGRWNLGNRLLTEQEATTIKNFFLARRGKFQGFRLKDWTDYKDDGRGIMNDGLSKPEVTQYRTFKKYQSGLDFTLRQIYKPVAIGYRKDFKIILNGVEIDYDVEATTSSVWIYDFTSGILNYIPPIYNIESYEAINALQTRITFDTTHDFNLIDYVNFAGNIVPIVEIEDGLNIIIRFNATMFNQVVNSVEKRLPLNASFKWEGEFDIPVRFDTDSLPFSFVHGQYGQSGVENTIDQVLIQLGDVPLVELKL